MKKVCGGDGGIPLWLPVAPSSDVRFSQMRETPRPQGTAGDAGPGLPQRRTGRAIAHTAGASGSGTPHRSDGRSPHTPRGARQTDPTGHLGTIPPVPRWPVLLVPVAGALLALFLVITWQVLADGPLLDPDERLGLELATSGPARARRPLRRSRQHAGRRPRAGVRGPLRLVPPGPARGGVRRPGHGRRSGARRPAEAVDGPSGSADRGDGLLPLGPHDHGDGRRTGPRPCCSPRTLTARHG